MAFNKSTRHLLSRKYWHYIGQIAKLEPVKRFCNIIRAILCRPPSSAGIEHLYSSEALVHTKLRNSLTNDRVAKLVQVYSLCTVILDGMKNKLPFAQNSEITKQNYEDDIELISTLVYYQLLFVMFLLVSHFSYSGHNSWARNERNEVINQSFVIKNSNLPCKAFIITSLRWYLKTKCMSLAPATVIPSKMIC